MIRPRTPDLGLTNEGNSDRTGEDGMGEVEEAQVDRLALPISHDARCRMSTYLRTGHPRSTPIDRRKIRADRSPRTPGRCLRGPRQAFRRPCQLSQSITPGRRTPPPRSGVRRTRLCQVIVDLARVVGQADIHTRGSIGRFDRVSDRLPHECCPASQVSPTDALSTVVALRLSTCPPSKGH